MVIIPGGIFPGVVTSLDSTPHLLLDKEGNLRLSGFGVGHFEGAKYPKFHQSADVLPSNVRWLAPEVLKDDFSSKHSDVW